MDLIEIAALSLRADTQRLSTIAQNLSNAATPGYKRVVAVQDSFAGALRDAERLEAGQATAAAVHDFSAGALRTTGRALDITADAGAFLELRTAQGPVYARGGSFQVDAQGRVMLGGAALQLMDGELRLQGTEQQVRIDAQGQVFVEERLVGRLRVVSFEDPGKLVALGAGLFDASNARIQHDAVQARVMSGVLEASNVQPAQEMVRLMETTRHFEAMQKIVQGYDEALEKAIRKFGEV